MTAIVMVFEMTRDYAIIVPVIVGVAVAAGIRRSLIGETIYTVKLRHRGHRIPKERHINLYLVKQAQDIMERRFILAKAGTTLTEAIGAEDTDDLRAIIVEREGRIVGLIPPRSGLWLKISTQPESACRTLRRKPRGYLQGHRFVKPRVCQLKRHRSGAAIVFRGVARPKIRDIVGVITKRAIADTVIASYDD